MTVQQKSPEELNPQVSFSRHQFLEIAWKGMLGLASALGIMGIVRYFSYEPDPPPPAQIDLGAPDQYPPGSVTEINTAEAILIHTGTEFVALSLICPHLGCIVEQAPSGFACPCHGSRFSADGTLQQGPANRPLQHLQISIDQQGHLILYRTLK
jgi:cytochrome b6-f complex iron-sulfur subunit